EYQRVSIGRLFIAGIVPGILMAVALIVAAFFLPRTMPQVAARAAQPALVGGGGASQDLGPHLGTGAFTAPEDEPFSQSEAEVAEHVGDGTARQHWVGALLRAIPG